MTTEQEKPKAFVNKNISSLQSINEMLEHKELFDRCIGTVNFAFHFNQLANKAHHYDFIVKNILKDYENGN